MSDADSYDVGFAKGHEAGLFAIEQRVLSLRSSLFTDTARAVLSRVLTEIDSVKRGPDEDGGPW